MLTAKEIANRLVKAGIPAYTVNYRLTVLRNQKAIKYKTVGKTYQYYAGAVNKVTSFGRKKL